jgi:hypothetical protein
LKEKILFWLSKDMVHFGIANSLQKQHDCDLYALIETNEKIKSFFYEQDLVKFKKSWFLFDEIQTTKEQLDLDYLRNFEKRLKINLWMIVYSERKFLHYNKYHKFSYEEILPMIEKECKFFEQLIDKLNPDFVILRQSDFHHIQLFYEICKAKGIKTIMMTYAKLPFRWTLTHNDQMDSIKDHMDKEIKNNNSIEQKSFDALSQSHKFIKFSSLKNRFNVRSICSVLQFFFDNGKDRSRHTDYGRTTTRMIFQLPLLILKSSYRKFFIDHNLIKNIKNEKFVYYPLQVDPERVTLTAAPFYSNQLEVIKNIAKSLPVDHYLYVKEHPGQKIINWRKISFYKQILELPNVKLIHPSVHSKLLLKQCSLVITITSSVGMEALQYGKPVISFGDNNYNGLPSIYRINSLEDLPKVIRVWIEKKVDPSEVESFLHYVNNNSFIYDPLELLDTEEFFSSLLSNLKFSKSEMEIYLNKNKLIFDKLAIEHIKKLTHIQIKDKN